MIAKRCAMSFWLRLPWMEEKLRRVSGRALRKAWRLGQRRRTARASGRQRSSGMILAEGLKPIEQRLRRSADGRTTGGSLGAAELAEIDFLIGAI